MNDDAALFLALSGQLGGSGGRNDDDRKPSGGLMANLENNGEGVNEQGGGDDDEDTNSSRARMNRMLQNSDFGEAFMSGSNDAAQSFSNSALGYNNYQGQGPAPAMSNNFLQSFQQNFHQNYQEYGKQPSGQSIGGANGDHKMPIMDVANDNDDEQPKAVYQAPPFLISDVRRKNASGAPLCLAVGCDKNAQANTRINDSTGFCRAHYHAWLISSGRVESWDCECGNTVPADKRCGRCHRWRGRGERDDGGGPAPGPSPAVLEPGMGDGSGGKRSAPAPASGRGRSGKSAKGKSSRKAGGGDKPGQSKAQHFAINDGCDWTCVCGQLMPGKQKRCGKCNKWKGGKRAPYSASTKTKKKRKLPDAPPEAPIAGGNWTCKCGNEVPGSKSRCGRCHHWRGGKRKGGWKIKMTPRADNVDDGIDWDKDWQCCGEAIPAAKKRCGSCHGWRGGKRVASKKLKTSYGTKATTIAPRQTALHTQPSWECSNCKISNPGPKRKCGGCKQWKKNIKSSSRASSAQLRAEERASVGATTEALTTLVGKEESSDAEDAVAEESFAGVFGDSNASSALHRQGSTPTGDGGYGDLGAVGALHRQGGTNERPGASGGYRDRASASGYGDLGAMGALHGQGSDSDLNEMNALNRPSGYSDNNALNALYRQMGNNDHPSTAGGYDNNTLNAILQRTGGSVEHTGTDGGFSESNAMSALLRQGGNSDHSLHGGFSDSNTMNALYRQGGNTEHAGLRAGFNEGNAMSALLRQGGNADHGGHHGGYGEGNAMSALLRQGGNNQRAGGNGGYNDDNALSALVRMGMATLGTLGSNGGQNSNADRAGADGGRGNGNGERSGADGGRDGNLEHAAFV